MNVLLRSFIGLIVLIPVAAQGVPKSLGAGVFLAQGMGGEKELYRTGGGLEFTWHFMPGRSVEGRLRMGLFTLGPGSKKGRFAVPYEARSEGLSVGWDFLFAPEGRSVIGFVGAGGCLFRYSYRHVPDNVTLVNPADPPVRNDRETTAALGVSGGIIVPVGRSVEVELRYTWLKHPGVVVLGPVGEGFLGDTLDPAPSHLAAGLRWRF